MPPIPRRPQLGREFILLQRRRRFVAAAAELADEFGVGEITVALICQRTGSARTTFYDLFQNVEDCLRFAVADTVERLFATVLAPEAEGDWHSQVQTAIGGFYAEAAAEPLLAELLLVHSFGVPLAPGDLGLESGVEAFEKLFAGGLPAGRGDSSALADEYLARVVVAGASAALRAKDLKSLPTTAAAIASLVVYSYLGSEGAAVAGL